MPTLSTSWTGTLYKYLGYGRVIWFGHADSMPDDAPDDPIDFSIPASWAYLNSVSDVTSLFMYRKHTFYTAGTVRLRFDNSIRSDIEALSMTVSVGSESVSVDFFVTGISGGRSFNSTNYQTVIDFIDALSGTLPSGTAKIYHAHTATVTLRARFPDRKMKAGDDDVVRAYVGSQEVTKAYVGEDVVLE